jgi:CDP-paratose 2-epimerase
MRAFEAVRGNLSKTAGQVYNVGGGRENTVSLLELMEHIQKLTGRTMDYVRDQRRPGDQLVYVSDYSKLTRDTGWKPESSVRDTLQQIHVWWNKNRELFPAAVPETTALPAAALQPRMAS